MIKFLEFLKNYSIIIVMRKKSKNKLKKHALYIVPLLVFFMMAGFAFAVMENFSTSYNEKQYSKMVSFSENISSQIYEITMRSLARISSIRDTYILTKNQNNKVAFDNFAKNAIDFQNIHSLMILDKTVVSKIYSKQNLDSLIGYDFARNGSLTLTEEMFISKQDGALFGPHTLPNGDKILSVVSPVYETTDGKQELKNIIALSINFPDAYKDVSFKEIEQNSYSYRIWAVNPAEGRILTIFESEKPVSPMNKKHTVTFSRRAFTSTWFYTFEPHVTFYQTGFFYVLAFVMIFITLIIPSAAYIIIKGINTENSRKALKYQLKLSSIQENTIYGLSNLVENRDSTTGDHVRRTSEYVMLLAKYAVQEGFYQELLSPEYIQLLGKAAALHDIGKIIIPDNILKKPAKLTPEEFEQIKTHTTEGAKIIREIFGPIQTTAFTNTAIEIASSHHERWDGKGYPSGLSGVTIPLSARFMAIADVFDALTTPRCYKKSFIFEDAVSIIKEGRGSQFDPVITDIFLKNKNAFKDILEKYMFQFS